MDIVVFGANGPTGRLLVSQAAAAGHRVTAVTRHPEAFTVGGYPASDAGVTVVRGDVLEPFSVEAAVAGQGVVISVIGVPYSRKPISVYSKGISHILCAMDAHRVSRLVCVSSAATDSTAGRHGGAVFGAVVEPILTRVVGRTLYNDMRNMEARVMASRLEWTIVRPSALFDTPTVTDYQVSENYSPGQYTARADLADCLLRSALDRQNVRKIVAVTTVSAKPSLTRLLWKEAVVKRG